MSFFSFLKKKPKENYSVVFNIGSGSVTGAVIRFTDKPGVEVLTYFQESIPFQKEVSVSRHIELMKRTLATVVKKIHKNHLKVDKAFYLFASPWSVSETRTIRLKESKPFKLTEAYLKKVVDEEVKKSDFTVHNKVIEQKIIQVKANGYVVNQFAGELVREAEVSVLYSVVPQDLLDEVEMTVSKHLVVKNIWCHSVSLPIFSVIRDLFPNRDDFVYLDVSEEMTDLAIVKNEVVLSHISFPMGRNYFLRAISHKLKVTADMADSMLKLHTGKAVDPRANVSFNLIINDIINTWLSQVNEVRNRFAESVSLPEQIFFVATNDLTVLLSDKLKEGNYEVQTVEAKKISSPIQISDTIFKICLIFLDKVYKI